MQGVKHRLDELDRKYDIMMWKISRLETMGDVGVQRRLNEVKPIVNTNSRSFSRSENPLIGASASTAKRVYNRRSTTVLTPRRSLKESTKRVVELSDEDDGLVNHSNSRGKNIPGVVSTTPKRPRPMSCTNNDMLTRDHSSPSSFRIGLPPLMVIKVVLMRFFFQA